MPLVSAVFLVLALVMAVVIGPQTRPWPWGPAMVALGMAVLAAVPVYWRRGKALPGLALLVPGLAWTLWVAWRAWTSPVTDLAMADGMLLAGGLGAYFSVLAVAGDRAAEKTLAWGIALLLGASLVVIGKQLANPGYLPVFGSAAQDGMISGFFAHYNDAANYLIASALWLGAGAVVGPHGRVTRALFGLLAAAGLAAVWFTRSRGGIFAAAVACAVFAVFLLVLARKRHARWFAAVLIAIPVIGLGLAAFLWQGWQSAQEARQATGGIPELLDNNSRLYLLGIALSCMGLHPWAGGGSRSFSWECFRFWEHDAQGAGESLPELAHNEFIQTATDYGMVGAVLLGAVLLVPAWAATMRMLFEDGRDDARDAWRLGALAALAGMLVQGCFSFVFHMLPGVVLLGCFLGQLSRAGRPSAGGTRPLAARVLLTGGALAAAVFLLGRGWVASRVTWVLWPSYFGNQGITSSEARIDALGEALGLWPQAAFYQDRAAVFQMLAGGGEQAGLREAAGLAVEDYHHAIVRHRYDPALRVNQANLLSQLRREAEAEHQFTSAIALQGGMEAAFRARFSYAAHLYHTAMRHYQAAAPAAALKWLEPSAEQVEEAARVTPWHVFGKDGRATRLAIHESLGLVHEAAGDLAAALRCYDHAATLPEGMHAHYRAGVVLRQQALAAWYERDPGEALKLFQQGRQRLEIARGSLPRGVTPSERMEAIAYFDRMIGFLKGARVQPND